MSLKQPSEDRGRGASSNRSGRFEAAERVAFDDGWGSADEPPLPLRTRVSPDRARTVIARNQSPDVPFDQSINPYRGCEHGCVYCFARPTHAYLGLSPGLDFESRLFFKADAAELLRRELGRPSYRCRLIALGANTDPYQPIERSRRVTRQVLEVLLEHRHPVGIVTKSNLVLRDLELLAELAARGLVNVFVSVTTLDRQLARKMEPRAPTPRRRLEAIERLARAGVPVAALVAPVIPALNDAELEAIVAAVAAAGARQVSYVLLRLPLEIKELFSEWLERHQPLRAKHVLSQIRQTRRGKLYQAKFGARMHGSGPIADLIEKRFRLAKKRAGLEFAKMPGLDTGQFRVPGRGHQLSLC